MATYKTITQAQLWTKTGNKAGTTSIGAVVTLSGLQRLIKERTCVEISSSNYAGKWIEPKYLEEIAGTEPPPVEPPPDDQIAELTQTILYEDGHMEVVRFARMATGE